VTAQEVRKPTSITRHDCHLPATSIGLTRMEKDHCRRRYIGLETFNPNPNPRSQGWPRGNNGIVREGVLQQPTNDFHTNSFTPGSLGSTGNPDSHRRPMKNVFLGHDNPRTLCVSRLAQPW
jgi:hypothetical protein